MILVLMNHITCGEIVVIGRRNCRRITGCNKKTHTLTNQPINKPTDYLTLRYSFFSEKEIDFQVVENALLYRIQKCITS